MAIFITVVAVLCWLFAGLTFVGATGLPQQVLAAEFGIAGAVLFGAAAVVDAVRQLHTTVALAATAANKARRES